MEAYRITKDSPAWQFKAYDYVRTDAFVFGYDIPINFEFEEDKPVDENYRALILVDDNKPIAGCRITFPFEGVGKIGRVCVIRENQRGGIGSRLIEEAEKWILETEGVTKVVINAMDRVQGFYEKLGYEYVPKVDPRFYEEKIVALENDIPRDYEPKTNPLGFANVLVEKKVS
ncbi:MAG: GNAT family N-acetyltransferase [Lachnospiraceae bacterium]|nr:GNAT family N-acetyltransferase [Lachnospiraceae bacterium]